MRRLGLLVVVGALQGCTFVEGLAGGEELGLRSLSTLYADARGLELTADGASGLVGMNSTTCGFDSALGMTGSDYDVSGASDTVEAGECGPDSVCDYAVVSGEKVSVVTPDAWNFPEERRFRGLVDATLIQDGVAVLSQREGGCVVEFAGRRSLQVRDTVAMPDEACAGATLERGDAGSVFVAADEGLYVVDLAGQERIGDGVERIAWDPTAAALYTADADATVVRAREADGSPLWREDLGGTVLAFDDAGDRGGVVVMVEDLADEGRVLFLDGGSGRIDMEEPLPGVARAVRTSADGGTVALVRDADVLFFALEEVSLAPVAEEPAFEFDLEGF